MASYPHVLVSFLVILSAAMNATATRNIPADSKPVVMDKKDPQWLGIGHFDGSVLVPGFGRYMIPKKGSHVNPFTYNPITGRNDGNGAIIRGVDGASGGGGSYVPGGDDTLLPNPGVEVPNPAAGAVPAAPSSP